MVKDNKFRANLLVTAGARAAYMDCSRSIDLPGGIEGEDELAEFVEKTVDQFIATDDDTNFDIFIETALIKKYGKKSNPIYEAYKLALKIKVNNDLTSMDDLIGYLGQALE